MAPTVKTRRLTTPLHYQAIGDLLAAAVLAVAALVTRWGAGALSFFDSLDNETNVGDILTALLWSLAAAAAVRGIVLLIGAHKLRP